jgi:hypothetical protein
MIYDPLSNAEWRAFQDSRQFQASLRHCEEATGKVHPLSDTRVQNAEPVPEKQNPNAGVVQAFPKGRW